MGYFAGESEVHGTGLFTTTAIKKGEVLGSFGTIPLTSPPDKSHPYQLKWVDGTYKVMTCQFRYINHSDTPNVDLYDDHTIVSSRDIEAYDELFSDYGDMKDPEYT